MTPFQAVSTALASTVGTGKYCWCNQGLLCLEVEICIFGCGYLQSLECVLSFARLL